MRSRSAASRLGRPLIGVTTSEVRRAETIDPTPRSDPPRLEMALGLVYLQAIEAAGGLPVVIPPLEVEAIEPILDRFEGFCLSGGPDLDPETYGARPHPELGQIEPALDRFELAIARSADAREMPLLAICRGMQALNVVRGGTLHQHWPDVDGALVHRQREPGDKPTHDIRIEAGSSLSEMAGADELAVNSFHHQAIDELGERLRPVAWASDGAIEAVEDPGRRFLVGVQWHAEALAHRPEERELFERFVDASRREGGAQAARGQAAA
jgi:putative glutamine amidotransferase